MLGIARLIVGGADGKAVVGVVTTPSLNDNVYGDERLVIDWGVGTV